MVGIGTLVSFESQIRFKLGCRFGPEVQIRRSPARGRNVLL